MSLISQIFGNFKKTAAEPPLPPFTAAAAKIFFIAFLTESGNLESFETMLFFSVAENGGGRRERRYRRRFFKDTKTWGN